MDIDELMAVDEVAAKLRVSIATVRMWLSAGKLRKTKAGSRTLVAQAELRRFIAESTALGVERSLRKERLGVPATALDLRHAGTEGARSCER